jgi:hypothetical protein
MHPAIIEAVAAEQVRELQAGAAAARRARQLRRSRHARLFTRFRGAGRGLSPRPTAQPLRGPRAA